MKRSSAPPRVRTLFVFLGILLLALGTALAPLTTVARQSPPLPNPAVTGAPTLTVRILSSKYDPDDVTLKIGQSINFDNLDAVGHTVTASDGSFDSGYLGRGDTWQTSFAQARTILYSDIYHTSMHGRITVVVN